MAIIRESEVRIRARRRAQALSQTPVEALNALASIRRPHFDIFLSQSIRDAEIVLGIYDLLVEQGYSVFCDWIIAPEVSRFEVSPTNAAFVRGVMTICDTFLFLDTEQADQSLWMCWELGWFDGQNGHVAILPVLEDKTVHYRSREFLGLYPYVEIDEKGKLILRRPVVTGPAGFTILESPNMRSFDGWRSGNATDFRPRVMGPWREATARV
jgi:hypothetical protein